MKAWKKLVIVIVAGVTAIGGVCLTMVEKTDAAIQKTVVAVINDEEITLGEVNDNLKGLYTSLETQYGTDYLSDSQIQSYILYQRQGMLSSLVQEKLMVLQAEKLGIVPSQEELETQVNAKMEELKEYFESSGESYDDYIETYGENSVREMFKNSIISEILEENMTKDLTVSDEEVETYYNENKDSYLNYGSADVKELIFNTEEEANAASEAIANGTATFDALYAEYEANIEKIESENATDEDKNLPTASDLGTISYDSTNYGTTFMDALKGITEDNKVSAPVNDASQYVIIQGNNIVATTDMPLDDELKEEIRETVLTKKKNDFMTENLTTWETEFGAETYTDKLEEGL
ncbi:MAG: SurA N-terminal domain-containing protein [Clostridium perfringens]|nr:SurA N-terminal domain-containing protein [Clostridium perfringens]